MTSIFENCVLDMDLLQEIGKYVVINRSKLNYNKVVEEFNELQLFLTSHMCLCLIPCDCVVPA